MLLIGRERGKGQIGKIPGESPSKSGKSRKNRKSPKKDKKGQKRKDKSRSGNPPRLKPPRLAALETNSNIFPRKSHHALSQRTIDESQTPTTHHRRETVHSASHSKAYCCCTPDSRRLLHPWEKEIARSAKVLQNPWGSV